MKFPVAIRTRNRPAYLDVTLRSLMATKLPPACDIVVLDDCSDDETSKLQLTTSGLIELPEPCVWPVSPRWAGRVGNLKNVTHVQGLRDLVEIMQPETKKGVRGGIFWCIATMMEKYPAAEAVAVIEGDVVFNADWYDAVNYAYDLCKDAPGPNGNMLGLLTAYDRKPGKPTPTGFKWRWCSVRRRGNGNWHCGGGIGGVMYLVTRRFYDAAVVSFQAKYNPNKRSGDTYLQGVCGAAKFSIASTGPAFIQHIGVASSAWPNKGWRHATKFRTPFAIIEKL
ncbi:MAG TPA: hypothetical protein ENH11_00070 [Candidatus Acetothermia bacterium]|nr:hypothetical protein [Candidatus Acetothermia bacterium]